MSNDPSFVLFALFVVRGFNHEGFGRELSRTDMKVSKENSEEW